MNSECLVIIPQFHYGLLKLGMLEDLRKVTNAKEIKEGKEFKVEFTE